MPTSNSTMCDWMIVFILCDRPTSRIRSAPSGTSTRLRLPVDHPTPRVSCLKKSALRPSSPTLLSGSVSAFSSSRTGKRSLLSCRYVTSSYLLLHLCGVMSLSPPYHSISNGGRPHVPSFVWTRSCSFSCKPTFANFYIAFIVFVRTTCGVRISDANPLRWALPL
jgi:hypothetical protein